MIKTLSIIIGIFIGVVLGVYILEIVSLGGYNQACQDAAYDINHTNDGVKYSTDLIEPHCGRYLK